MTITLRHWALTDAPALTRTIDDKAVQDNLRDGIPYPYTEEDAVEFITAMLAAPPDTQWTFAICAGDKVIGSIGVFRQANIHRQTGELGYYIAKAYWGRGVATQAVRQICNYVFAKTDVLRIFADPFAYNIASCRVLEKAGFQFEGVLRQSAVKNGTVLDMKMYSLIREEWQV